MASDGPEFPDERKFSAAPYDAPPRQRGCLFYGCLIGSVLSMLITVLLGTGLYLTYRALDQFILNYTTTAPKELPKLEMSKDERQAVKSRAESFGDAIQKGETADTLVLDSDEVNALIEDHADLKGKLHVTLKGDEIHGQVSLPLTDFINVGLTRGRYLNGEAKLKASLKDGVPIVTIESLNVNGKEPPKELVDQLRSQNLAANLLKDPNYAETIRKFESIEVKDGKLIIKARSPNAKAKTGGDGENADHAPAGEAPKSGAENASKPDGPKDAAAAAPKSAPAPAPGSTSVPAPEK